MNKLKVSVIIPCYNEEKYLTDTLESITTQSVTPFEIIVVDNNSKDKTSEIAKSFGVKVISEPRQGLTYARNRGFDEARGDILMRTDADSVPPKDWVEKMSREFESNPKLSTATGSAILGSSSIDFIVDCFCFYINDIFGYNSLLGPNFCIRKKVWEKVKPLTCNDDGHFHEDLDMAIHTGAFGEYKRRLDIRVLTSNRRVIGISGVISLYKYFHVKWRNTIFLKKHRKLSKRWWMRVL